MTLPNISYKIHPKTQLSVLAKDVVEADANYFRHQGFISDEDYRRVTKWLSGQNDHEIQQKIAGWLDSDAQYFRDLAPSLYRHHWYISPIIRLAVTGMSSSLSNYAKKLRG